MPFTVVPQPEGKSTHASGKSVRNTSALALAIHLACTGLVASTTVTLPMLWSSHASAQGNVESQACIAFDIPGGSLSQALNRFAEQTGLYLSGAGELTNSKTSSGLKGEYTVADSLQQLLAGSGITFRFSDENTVTLMEGSDGTTTLPPVKVRGESIRESAYGPVDGYVAKQSATATKTDTPILETPQSISVVSRKDMDVRNVRDVGEAVSYTSGVTTGTTGETTLFGGNNIRIRGFGGNGTAGASFNEYLDGLKLQSSGYVASNLDPWLLERVEVLKGPASVLFGQTQPGGIVNMVSKRPHDHTINQVGVGTDSLDKASATFDLGGELSDTWQFRVVGLGLDGETQQDHSERERLLLAPSLRWTNGTTDLTLFTHYQRDDINASILSIVPRDGVFSNPTGRVPLTFRVGDPGFEFWDRETLFVGYLFSHDFNDALTFRQNLRFTNNKQDSRWIYRQSLNIDQRTLNRRSFQSQEDADNLTIDNQLQWKLTTGTVIHTVLTGIDCQKFSDTAAAAGGSAPTIDLFAPAYNQIIPTPTAVFWDDEDDIRQIGIYMQDQTKFGALSLLVGGRYDDAETSTKDNLSASTTTESDNDFTARVGIIYNFANGFAPYASYAESFEPVSGTAFDGSRFEPMKGKQYEVGVKYQPSGTDHLVTLAAFDLTQEDMTTADPVNTGFSIQIGEVQTRGIELEGKFSVNDNLDVTAAYTHLDDEVTKSNNGDEGNQRAQIPKQTASLWANYSFIRGTLAGIGLGMGVRYTGETEGDSGNTFSVPSYTLVDLAVHYDLGLSPLGLKGWQASLNVNNLFDKYYIASCFATHSCYLGQERSIRASVEYSW